MSEEPNDTQADTLSKGVRHPIVIQDGALGLRVVGVRCLDGSTRALGAARHLDDLVALALSSEWPLTADELRGLLGTDVRGLLRSLARQGRVHQRGMGLWWRGGVRLLGKQGGGMQEE
jgi:hypothetical protein